MPFVPSPPSSPSGSATIQIITRLHNDLTGHRRRFIFLSMKNAPAQPWSRAAPVSAASPKPARPPSRAIHRSRSCRCHPSSAVAPPFSWFPSVNVPHPQLRRAQDPRHTPFIPCLSVPSGKSVVAPSFSLLPSVNVFLLPARHTPLAPASPVNIGYWASCYRITDARP